MKKISSFENMVYEATKKIPKGMLSTYAQIARQIANPKSYRAVGNALNKNPFAPEVPCHRVVTSKGFLGGFSYGVNKKKALLKREGIEIKGDKVVDFENKLVLF